MALTLFFVSVAFVVYVLAIYPVFLAILSRSPGRPVAKAPQRRTVSVILPVYNGEAFLRAKLDSLLALDYPRELVEVLVISDASEDASDDIAHEYSDAGVKLIRIARGGKAMALNAGVANARGDILFFTDVRQALAPNALTELVACLSDPRVGAASGELIILNGDTLEEASVGAYWKYEKWIRTRLSRIDSVLGTTGCLYAMRRELARPLPASTLLDDMYQPLGVFFQGYRVILDSTAKAYDYPTALNTEFRRKIRTLAGVYQVIGDYPALLSPFHNRMWIHFASHKFGRLLLPWALVVVSVTAFWLPPALAKIVVQSQILLYALALADPIVPEGSVLKLFSAPLRTFVVLMAAALCAVVIFFRSSTSLWTKTSVRTARPLS